MYIYSSLLFLLPFSSLHSFSTLLFYFDFYSHEILKMKMVLVIASTNLMEEIANAIDPQPCGLYDSGSWFYNEVCIHAALVVSIQ